MSAPVPTGLAAGAMLGILGGGQLARMTHQAAIALGQTLRVLAVSADEPAAQVSPAVVLGSHTDLDALRQVADGASALTFDHEHVPTELLQALVAEGVNVAPPPSALVHAQDKAVMRERRRLLGGAGRSRQRHRGPLGSSVFRQGAVMTFTPHTIDPELDLVYYGTGNPGPDYHSASREGDNLYSDSIVAVDADTGRLRWHYQFTPHDVHDYDATQVPILADLTIGGQPICVRPADQHGPSA